MLFSIVIAHPVYDSIFFLSAIMATISALYFRKQTTMMKEQLRISMDDSEAKAQIAATLQNRVNDEIMGYAAAPGILAKMGLTERVFLIDKKATALDKKTDLQNVVIGDMASTVKQLLPNGGNSVADKIDKMGIMMAENNERLIGHLVTSDATRQDLSDRITHMEQILSHTEDTHGTD